MRQIENKSNRKVTEHDDRVRAHWAPPLDSPALLEGPRTYADYEPVNAAPIAVREPERVPILVQPQNRPVQPYAPPPRALMAQAAPQPRPPSVTRLEPAGYDAQPTQPDPYGLYSQVDLSDMRDRFDRTPPFGQRPGDGLFFFAIAPIIGIIIWIAVALVTNTMSYHP